MKLINYFIDTIFYRCSIYIRPFPSTAFQYHFLRRLEFLSSRICPSQEDGHFVNHFKVWLIIRILGSTISLPFFFLYIFYFLSRVGEKRPPKIHASNLPKRSPCAEQTMSIFLKKDSTILFLHCFFFIYTSHFFFYISVSKADKIKFIRK